MGERAKSLIRENVRLFDRCQELFDSVVEASHRKGKAKSAAT